MAGKGSARCGDLARHRDHLASVYSTLLLGKLRCVRGIEFFDGGDKIVERCIYVRMLSAHVLVPIQPLLHEVAVVKVFLQDDVRHGKQHCCLRTRPRREPVVCPRGRVGEPRIDNANLGAGEFALDDALSMGIEIVAGFQVGADQQHKPRVCVVGRGSVGALPKRVAEACAGRANVGMAVVSIHTPCLEHTVHIAVVTGATDVIHHLSASVLLQRGSYARSQRIKHFVPVSAFPLTRATSSGAFHGVENALRIVHLVDGRRTLGAIPAAASGMRRIAFELADAHVFFIDICQQSASSLAVEAHRRDQHVVLGDLLRPDVGIVLCPVIPLLNRWVAFKLA